MQGAVQVGVRVVSKSWLETMEAAPPETFIPAMRLVQPLMAPADCVVTVTAADADLLLSATLVAVTVNVPAAPGAVYKPPVLTVPPVAVHVTTVLVLPVTVAVNCCVALICRVAAVGLMVTATGGGEASVTVTVEDADFVVSATLVAVTVNVPAELPAVYRPAELTVPPVAVQLTAVFVLPETVAVNCWVAPVCTLADVGLTVTETAGGGVEVACDLYKYIFPPATEPESDPA